MFRKPKRKAKEGLRVKESEDEEDNTTAATETTSELVLEARKRTKTAKPSTAATAAAATPMMHSYQSAKDKGSTNADLATSTAQHLPENMGRPAADAGIIRNDGIFRNTDRNKFLAGPLKAAQNVRVTTRFDYEPSICKDYKETGFCGFGDTCIYLHDRGDTMSGWQLEQQWEEQQRKKKEHQEKEIQGFVDEMTATMEGGKTEGKSEVMIMPEDGLPFACYLCREHFKDPVVTSCNHYFCESCIMNHTRTVSEECPVCSQNTGSVFNQPTKLVAKKKKVLGKSNAKADNSWEEFAKAFAKNQRAEETS
jgi:RING finger protein 113A